MVPRPKALREDIGLDQSVPTPQTQEPALVVIRVAVGAPEAALAPSAGPAVVSALRKATTVMAACQLPDACVAVTVAFDSGPGAMACQISAVHGCVLVLCRSVQLSPAPVTAAIRAELAQFGPSELMKARRSSLEPVVVTPGALMVVELVP